MKIINYIEITNLYINQAHSKLLFMRLDKILIMLNYLYFGMKYYLLCIKKLIIRIL